MKKRVYILFIFIYDGEEKTYLSVVMLFFNELWVSFPLFSFRVSWKASYRHSGILLLFTILIFMKSLFSSKLWISFSLISMKSENFCNWNAIFLIQNKKIFFLKTANIIIMIINISSIPRTHAHTHTYKLYPFLFSSSLHPLSDNVKDVYEYLCGIALINY